MSTFSVSTGLCVDPYNQSNSYYYGDIVSAGKCPDAKYEVYGSPEVQCIMGNSWNETRWSGPFPHCQGKIAWFSICQLSKILLGTPSLESLIGTFYNVTVVTSTRCDV